MKTNPKQSNQDLFIQEVDKHWIHLKDNEDTIFENIEIALNAGDKFDEMKEKYPEAYWELIHENSVYEKKKIIKEYFWDAIVGELYENTLYVMAQAGLLEEAGQSFQHSYKIEETAKLILENGIFAKFEDRKKKEIVDTLIESTFYPAQFAEKSTSFNYEALTNPKYRSHLVEEGFWRSAGNAGEWSARQITNAARASKSLYIILATFLVSPATVIMSNVAKQGIDKAGEHLAPGLLQGGTSPSARKFYSFIDSITPTKWVFSFLHKEQHEVFKYLKGANQLENPYIQDALKTAGGDSNKIVEKCWNQNKIQVEAKDREEATWWEATKHVISGKGLSNFIRNPRYQDENQLMTILNHDAGDPQQQKRYFDFRVCVYDKLFEIILGYAKAIYSMDDESYEIIKAANAAHKTKNYKAFFDLTPKQDNDAAMFAVMKALVAVDELSRVMETDRDKLTSDKYSDRFATYLKENIKQVYTQLDEMASQKKYNEDRYDEEDPDDEAKAKAIQADRFNQKKSIFTD